MIELRKEDYKLISHILGDFICDDIYIASILDGNGRGFGTLVASKMVEYTLKIGCKPDWGCVSTNMGSAAIALKLGFSPIGSHNIYSID